MQGQYNTLTDLLNESIGAMGGALLVAVWLRGNWGPPG
jgi:hypothetical protein